MARIGGIDLPRNKPAVVGLTYIYGIGPTTSRRILESVEVDPGVKVKDLSDDQITKIRGIIDREYRVEGDLRREVQSNIKRLIDNGSYRGLRHRLGLPTNGQRTRTNARTRRGARKTVAGRGQRRGVTKK